MRVAINVLQLLMIFLCFVTETSEINNVKKAINNWEEHTCLKFRPATSYDRHKVTFEISHASVEIFFYNQ